ncbi:hypothetical protein [Metabacillus fastidiosus]
MGGHGLGLAIAGIHGGIIQVSSEEGKYFLFNIFMKGVEKREKKYSSQK